MRFSIIQFRCTSDCICDYCICDLKPSCQGVTWSLGTCRLGCRLAVRSCDGARVRPRKMACLLGGLTWSYAASRVRLRDGATEQTLKERGGRCHLFLSPAMSWMDFGLLCGDDAPLLLFTTRAGALPAAFSHRMRFCKPENKPYSKYQLEIPFS